jgi:RNA exonuclease 1
VPRAYSPGQLESDWKYYSTSAASTPSSPIAVAIDCEMGTAESGDIELIRVSVVDYFTGAVLLDRLVYPNVKMAHFNTKFTGITRRDMEGARRNKTCLFGRNKARKAVYNLVGPETIVIGHGAQSDFNCMRWIHPLVIDTLLVEQEVKVDEDLAAEMELRMELRQRAEEGRDYEDLLAAPLPGQGGGLSLKALAKKLLDREIQVNGRGHDSTEDALATRDILHYRISQMMHPAPAD